MLPCWNCESISSSSEPTSPAGSQDLPFSAWKSCLTRLEGLSAVSSALGALRLLDFGGGGGLGGSSIGVALLRRVGFFS